jgi:hypothetical protein
MLWGERGTCHDLSEILVGADKGHVVSRGCGACHVLGPCEICRLKGLAGRCSLAKMIGVNVLPL